MKLVSEFVYEKGMRMKIQSTSTSIHFDAQTKIFRIDAAGIIYAFGVNAQDHLQSIYWGVQIGKEDLTLQPTAKATVASFDGSATTTPFEYVGWGAVCLSNRS
jgi:alpha-galactosidase